MRNDYTSGYLAHHGILGMKWGVRRYQNPDGSLTSAGKERYGKNEKEKTNKLTEDQKKAIRNVAIATATVATIAVGAYYANKYRNMHMDKIIKSGTQIQHMSKKCNELLNQPFYASYLKADNKAYAANDFFGSKWSHKMVMNAQKDLKIAGKKLPKKLILNGLIPIQKLKLDSETLHIFRLIEILVLQIFTIRSILLVFISILKAKDTMQYTIGMISFRVEELLH